MELKKNSRVDLRKWSGTFFNLGLAMSVGAVLVAFEWKAKDVKPLLDLSNGASEWETEIIPITIQTPPPVTPPAIVPPEIEVIDDDIVIDDMIAIDVDLSSTEPIPVIELSEPPTKEVADEILDFTEVRAEFQGGMEAWYKYLRSNLSYPKQAQRLGVEGTVIVRFVVNTNGSIQDVEVARSVDPSLDEAAMEVILNSPAWKPARHNGRAVRSRMTIPIKFKLN
ncbi:energy transducer TonB [Algoriphagus aestuariicola]|jgi:protein TonB|uniref:Energy transducer TonB n=1 Tax=Algoriphagus aestuariicola TaxID=1852016 RepID=A0ABS3BNS6_9BACT|nr:energy transducer TonB [Algoriphagus aestuariicola]MBN7799319.1 energy transducer TonB [Algoriphagus aestuariicola]